MATQPRRFLTPSEYLQLERNAEFRSEFADGKMFAMSGNTRTHNDLVNNLQDFLLVKKLRQASCAKFNSDMKVSIREQQRYCYPDVTLCCGEPEFEDEIEDVLLNPTVIFEVLSKKTVGYDLGDKSFYYRQLPTLRHVVLVWHDRIRVGHWFRTVDAHKPPGAAPDERGTAADLAAAGESVVRSLIGDDWNYADYDGIEQSVTLADCNLVLPLNDIYDGVTLQPR